MKTILRYRCFTPAVNAKSYITNTLNRIYSADAYRQPVRITKLLLLLLLFCSACSHNNDQTGNDGLTTQPVTRFEKIKWNEKKDENYIYRKQMVSNLLTQYQWAGIKKDSLIQMLGQPSKPLYLKLHRIVRLRWPA